MGVALHRPGVSEDAAAAPRCGVAHFERQRRAWFNRPLLRSAYARAWRELAAFAVPGPSLEVGCGCGNLDGVVARCWKSDIVVLPWADLAADALRLPFRSASLANLLAADVLHHLPRPLQFLAEAARVLRPGGRLLLLEPYVSLVSYPVYRYVHHEAADLACDLLASQEVNQALPTLLFCCQREVVHKHVPQLQLIHCQARDAIVYPLSGGYSYPSLLPRWAERWAWIAERWLRPLMPWIGFRLAVVAQRKEEQ